MPLYELILAVVEDHFYIVDHNKALQEIVLTLQIT